MTTNHVLQAGSHDNGICIVYCSVCTSVPYYIVYCVCVLLYRTIVYCVPYYIVYCGVCTSVPCYSVLWCVY